MPADAAPKAKPKAAGVNHQRIATDKASEEIRREQLERLSKANDAAAPNAKVKSSPGAAQD
jgi:hypothetical protein